MLLVQAIDEGLFRFVNQTLSNPLFDAVMPFASDTPFFRPLVFLILAALVWKGGVRGRICALMLALAVFVGDGLICGTLKRVIERPRPFLVLSDAIVRVGRGGSGSMPSSHAANWFAATAVTFIYYRRSYWFMLPLALLVSFSRIYCGVHYPTDVATGALLGAAYGAAGVWSLNALWQSLGRRSFPLWWKKLPSLLPPFSPARERELKKDRAVTTDQHWLRLGYLLIAVLLFARLAYIASDRIELSEDEALPMALVETPGAFLLQQTTVDCLYAVFQAPTCGETRLLACAFSRRLSLPFFPCLCSGFSPGRSGRESAFGWCRSARRRRCWRWEPR